ncbi:MAG: pyrroline-5-carboxylate reductase [Clostridia bacterium]|nr:pyrroline-5-carboxylate reductase [Clostridia bacterium]
MKTGFIGAGNMASAIIEGLVSSACLAPGDLAVFDVDAGKTAALQKKHGLAVCGSAREIAQSCACVVLAVKPNVLASVLGEIRDVVRENKPLLLTIAAGKPLSFYSETLGFAPRLVRVMPNINAVVGEAITAYCGNENAAADDLAFAARFCGAFGTAQALPETLFPVFGVVGGSAPAFAYLFIDALARAAVRYGMPRDKALAVCAQTALGSAKMVLESGVHPQELIDRVCSPGGTTIEGIAALQQHGFEAALAEAVGAAVEKDKRL